MPAKTLAECPDIEVHYDETHDRNYFYNKSTGKTSWKKEEALADARAAAAPPATPQMAPADGIETKVDAKGRTYFYERSTGKSAWTRSELSGSSVVKNQGPVPTATAASGAASTANIEQRGIQDCADALVEAMGASIFYGVFAGGFALWIHLLVLTGTHLFGEGNIYSGHDDPCSGVLVHIFAAVMIVSALAIVLPTLLYVFILEQVGEDLKDKSEGTIQNISLLSSMSRVQARHAHPKNWGPALLALVALSSFWSFVLLPIGLFLLFYLAYGLCFLFVFPIVCLAMCTAEHPDGPGISPEGHTNHLMFRMIKEFYEDPASFVYSSKLSIIGTAQAIPAWPFNSTYFVYSSFSSYTGAQDLAASSAGMQHDVWVWSGDSILTQHGIVRALVFELSAAGMFFACAIFLIWVLHVIPSWWDKKLTKHNANPTAVLPPKDIVKLWMTASLSVGDISSDIFYIATESWYYQSMQNLAIFLVFLPSVSFACLNRSTVRMHARKFYYKAIKSSQAYLFRDSNWKYNNGVHRYVEDQRKAIEEMVNKIDGWYTEKHNMTSLFACVIKLCHTLLKHCISIACLGAMYLFNAFFWFLYFFFVGLYIIFNPIVRVIGYSFFMFCYSSFKLVIVPPFNTWFQTASGGDEEDEIMESNFQFNSAIISEIVTESLPQLLLVIINTSLTKNTNTTFWFTVVFSALLIVDSFWKIAFAIWLEGDIMAGLHLEIVKVKARASRENRAETLTVYELAKLKSDDASKFAEHKEFVHNRLHEKDNRMETHAAGTMQQVEI
jgi:hypothetical protein